LKLIQKNGQPHFGHIETPLDDANYCDYRWRTAMGYYLPRWRRHIKCNQFQFVGLLSPDFIIGCAIVNLRLVANGFFYLYQPSNGKLEEWSWINPLALGCQTPTQPDQSRFQFRKGKNQLEIFAQGKQRQLRVQIGKTLELSALLSEPEGFQPVRLCSRAGYNGWVYTQKTNALPVEGFLNWKGVHFDLNKAQTLGGYDWTIGFMRRHTFWNWASCSAYLQDGKAFGFNLAAGVNETSYTENAIWFDHKRILLPSIQFHFDREKPLEPWTIKSSDGSFHARFNPVGLRRERVEAVILASNFRQVFGTFEGQFRDQSGTLHDFGPCWGFCEDHYARW
jgi:hypothetical protein